MSHIVPTIVSISKGSSLNTFATGFAPLKTHRLASKLQVFTNRLDPNTGRTILIT